MGDADAFVSGVYATAPHYWQGDGFDDLLSVADVDAQLSGGGLRRPAVRLARDGEVLPASGWTRRARTGSVWIDDLVDPARTLALFSEGATIVLQSLQRWWPPLTRFCRELEATLGHPVQVNAYLTPPTAAGFTPHHDTHDVFVLQVSGTKRWTVRSPLVDAPLERHRSDHGSAAAQPVLFEVDLAPGDCLYLPRGFIHSAAAQEEVSLHLTVGVLAVTRHDLLRRIVDRTAEEPAFRRSLPVQHAGDLDGAAGVVKDAVADLIAWLEGLDIDGLAAELVDREARRRHPLLDGQLVELTRLARLGDATTVVLRDGVRWRAEAAAEGRLALVLADRRLDLPAGLDGALRLLLDGSPRTVASLAHLLDEPSRKVLARRLVREGILRTVDGP